MNISKLLHSNTNLQDFVTGLLTSFAILGNTILTNLNDILTVLISLLSIIFLATRIYISISDHRKKKNKSDKNILKD